MLAFALGVVSDEFVDCLAEGGDADVCRELYPERLTPEEEALIEIDQPGTSTSALPGICSMCDPNTQWCDGSSCINFTPAEQAEWQQQWATVTATGAAPAGRVATSATPPSAAWVKYALAGAAGLAVVALLLLKRRK